MSPIVTKSFFRPPGQLTLIGRVVSVCDLIKCHRCVQERILHCPLIDRLGPDVGTSPEDVETGTAAVGELDQFWKCYRQEIRCKARNATFKRKFGEIE